MRFDRESVNGLDRRGRFCYKRHIVAEKMPPSPICCRGIVFQGVAHPLPKRVSCPSSAVSSSHVGTDKSRVGNRDLGGMSRIVTTSRCLSSRSWFVILRRVWGQPAADRELDSVFVRFSFLGSFAGWFFTPSRSTTLQQDERRASAHSAHELISIKTLVTILLPQPTTNL